jgi:uncharacterized protein YkwD
MRGFFSKVLLATLAAATTALAAPASAGEADDAVLAEVNFARANPQAYARRLMTRSASSSDPAHGGADSGALAEAVEFLMRQSPLPPLQADGRLAAAALEHVTQQGPKGEVGHDSGAGEPFEARLRRHGVAADAAGENIAYGPERAADVVRELIIDAGVPGRGHRRNIFERDFAAAGVSCGPHRVYRAMCVMDFAGRGAS